MVPEQDWHALCRSTPLFCLLDFAERERLRGLASILLGEKTLVMVQGVSLTQNQRHLLAALAALPILNLDIDWYEGFREIIIYPGEFVPGHEEVDELGVVHVRREPLSGEAWLRGPVILSWPDVEASTELDGYNVVIHEFAHKIDMQDGHANGMPPLHWDMQPQTWSSTFLAAFEHLNARLDAGEETAVDPYAAENPGEFFAVVSEMFFERPLDLRTELPAVYEQLVQFYRQDPVIRFR
jgi:MtfA peptidase